LENIFFESYVIFNDPQLLYILLFLLNLLFFIKGDFLQLYIFLVYLEGFLNLVAYNLFDTMNYEDF